MKYLLSCLILISSFACNNNGENGEAPAPASPTQPENRSPTIGQGQDECFRSITGRDTLLAALHWEGTAVSGKLVFDNYEKDGSAGSVTGEQVGDTIKLWYSFEAEGMHSVMQVWFQHQGENITRAIGPMENKGDSAFFSDLKKISFDSKQRYSKIDCAETR